MVHDHQKNRSIDRIELFSFYTQEYVGYFIYPGERARSKVWYEELETHKKTILYREGDQVYLVYPVLKLDYSKLLGAVEVRLDVDNITKHIKAGGEILSYELVLEEELIKGNPAGGRAYEVVDNPVNSL